MKNFTPKITILALVFLITLGLGISLQSVFGVNIGSNLDFGGIRRIIGLPVPTAGSEAATKGFVDSVAGTLQTRVTGTCPAGKVILIINADGSVICS